LVHKDSGVLLGFNFVLFAALIIIEIVTFVWTLISLADMYPKDSVAESIAAFRYAATFTDEVKKFPVILSGLRRVCEASGYLVAIVIAELIFKKDYRKLYLPITAFLFLIPLNLEVGSRTALFQEYFAFIVIFFLVRKFYTGQIVDLNRKTVGIAAILFIAFICVFQLMAVGRDYTQNPFYYIGTYIGAEIPNLDMFLNDSSNIAGNVGNSVTFIRSINLLGSVLGIDSLQYSLDLPFLTYGGVVTGNVYTTFRPFIYDFGYLGFVVLTMLMSCVSQLIYSLATNNIKSYRFIDIYMILYGVLSCQLLLSFFSNKFYERFFSLQFLLTIIILLVVRFIYKKLSLLLKNKFPNFCS
jgi:oligosaccharide repeat unit polymerase